MNTHKIHRDRPGRLLTSNSRSWRSASGASKGWSKRSIGKVRRRAGKVDIARRIEEG